jgi:hypothetical protein
MSIPVLFSNYAQGGRDIAVRRSSTPGVMVSFNRFLQQIKEPFPFGCGFDKHLRPSAVFLNA